MQEPLLQTRNVTVAADANCQASAWPVIVQATDEQMKNMSCSISPSSTITTLLDNEVTVRCDSLYSGQYVQSADVFMADLTPPTVLSTAPETFECGDSVTVTVLANDNCYGATVFETCSTQGVLPVGVYPTTCSISDPAGNTATASLEVISRDTLPPVVASLTPPMLSAGETVTIHLSDLVSTTDHCMGQLDPNRWGSFTAVDSRASIGRTSIRRLERCRSSPGAPSPCNCRMALRVDSR